MSVQSKCPPRVVISCRLFLLVKVFKMAWACDEISDGSGLYTRNLGFKRQVAPLNIKK